MLAHKTLTLDGTAQSLLSAFGAAEPVGGPNDVACSFIALQPEGSNANPVYVGGPGVTASDYGVCLAAAAAGVPPDPFQFPNSFVPIRLSNVYVIGTDTEKLQILYAWL